MEIRVATPADLDAYVDLLEEAGGWLWERGIRQWEPGSHRLQRPRLARDVERGCVRTTQSAATSSAATRRSTASP